MRKTKIICTLGPACESEEIMRELVLAGMDVARMNFSHGSYQEHKKRIDTLKKIREETGRPVALLLDTKGPEIRTGKFNNGCVTLSEGDSFILVHDDILGDEQKVSVSYKGLYRDVKKGDRILVDDGLIELEVTGIMGKDIHCIVINGGSLAITRGSMFPVWRSTFRPSPSRILMISGSVLKTTLILLLLPLYARLRM